MKQFWLSLMLIALALMLLGCAHGRTNQQVEPEPPHLEGVLRLVGRFGIAHACAFDDGAFAWTSAHVVDVRPFDPGVPLFGARWSDGYGNSGTVEPLMAFRDVDLALIRRGDGKPFPNPYPTAAAAPEPGQRIHINGYEYGNKRKAFQPKYTRGWVLFLLADNLVLDEDSRKGSSGGCVLNDAGEIVALPTWGPIPLDNHEEVALAVGVWSSIESITRTVKDARAWQEAQAQQ